MIDTFLMAYVIASRIFELILSNKNTKRLINEGAREYYESHYKFIVAFHLIFILFFLVKSFTVTNINLLYLYMFFVVQIVRYRIIYELGKYWTTRIIVVNKPLIKTWMFRNLRHPNYIVVFLEVILISLCFNDFYSLIFFSSINFILICIRIFYEEKANRFRRIL
jgi:methyltransferase